MIDKEFSTFASFPDPSLAVDMYEYMCKSECDETMSGGTNSDLSQNYLDGYVGC